MPEANDLNRRDYDTAASETTQGHFERVAGHLESLINQRDTDVKSAMSEYFATGVSEEYAGKEQRWNKVADEVKGIIRVLRASLETTDGTAHHANGQAGQAVASIG